MLPASRNSLHLSRKACHHAWTIKRWGRWATRAEGSSSVSEEPEALFLCFPGTQTIIAPPPELPNDDHSTPPVRWPISCNINIPYLALFLISMSLVFWRSFSGNFTRGGEVSCRIRVIVLHLLDTCVFLTADQKNINSTIHNEMPGTAVSCVSVALIK